MLERVGLGNVFELVSLAILCGGGQFDIRNLRYEYINIAQNL